MISDETVESWRKVYEEERKAVIDMQSTYERIVRADVTISHLTSEIELAIDNVRATVGITAGPDVVEAKIKRLFTTESRELRHLHRICKSLLSTIKSREFDLSR